MAVISTKPRLSNFSIRERNIEETNESFSSPLVNYVESNEIDGVQWTRFYTRVDTNLEVGDKVFIVNGNYDSYELILNYEYSQGSTGYNILEINTTSITLDIEWTGDLPWEKDPFDDYIKIYSSDNTQRTQYEVQQSKYYPFKYIFGYRANNNILFSSSVNEFRVADSSNYTTFNDWIDVTTELLSDSLSTLSISGQSITPNNGKLLIMDSFTYGGKDYDKGYVYTFDGNEWVKDVKHRRSFLSKSNFRSGSFNDGDFNDGIFGNIEETTIWNSNGKWNNGLLFNSVWESGVMNSKSDTINKPNHYTSLENGEIKQITDFNNNDGFGYNFAFDSIFSGGTINNINSDNCNSGNYTNPTNLVSRYLTNPNDNFNFGVTLNGRWVNSHIENNLIRSGLYEFSVIENSLSTNGRFSDTDIKYSVISGSMEGMGKINILNSEKLFTAGQYIEEDPFSPGAYNNNDNLIINYKFYVSERNYQRIKAGSEILLNDLITSSSDILNFFDNNLYLGVDKDGNLYVADNYGEKREVSVQLNSREQNANKRVLTTIGGAPQYPLQETTNPVGLPSLDIFIHFPNNGDLNNDLTSYLNGSSFDKNFRQDITDVTQATLQLGRFEKSIFNGGNWEASKVNNPDYQIRRDGSGDYLEGSFSGTDLTLTLDEFTGIFKPNQLEVGDIVYLSNISYDLGGTVLPVDGTYSIATYSTTPDLEVVLQDFGSQSIAGSYSAGGDFISSFIDNNGTYSLSDSQESFTSIHLEKIQNTEINRGFIKRELLVNDTFTNDDFVQQTELDIRNVNLLKVSEVTLTDVNDIQANSGLFIRTFIRDNEWDNGIIYQSVLKDLNFNNGIIKDSRWLSGTFSDGQFIESKRTIISSTSSLSQVFTNIDIESEWYDGTFNDGEFFDSIWTNGEFNGGKFYNSIFAAGVWNDGVFGDISFSNQSNKFGDATQTHRSVNTLGNSVPVWNDGTFNKGEFGLKSPSTLGTMSVPDPLISNITWNDGIFNDGTILSYSPTSSVIWNDGTFNNGDIIGYVQWNDGTFNNGKFRSSWGTGYGTQSSNYAWKDGIFNGGRFGEPEGIINVSLDGDITYRNPSWFGGRFNDGQFMGKVWNDGTFTGGRFMGNEDSSYSSNEYLETFPNNFEIADIFRTFFEGDLGTWKIGDTLFDLIGPISSGILIGATPSVISSNPYSISFKPEIGTFGSDTVFNSELNGEIYGLTSPVIEEEVESIIFSYKSYLEVPSLLPTTPVSGTISVNIEGSDPLGNTCSFTEDINIFAGTFNSVSDIDSVLEMFPLTPTTPNMEYKIIVDIEFDNNNWIESYFNIDDIGFKANQRVKKSSSPDNFVMDYSDESTVNFYGMWRNGEVISDNTVAVGESNFTKLSKLESVRRFKGDTNPNIFFENALWIDGKFNAFGQMDNCVWLSGEFNNGNFLNSAFNPYVPRWDFNLNVDTNTISEFYSFDLDDDSCIWKSGFLDNSEFSISIWENGTFNSGDMFGGLFKNGVSNYMNATNVIWENGLWRNGNWYGADFSKNKLYRAFVDGGGSVSENEFTSIQSKITDTIIKNSKRLSNDDLFVWSLVDTSDTSEYSSGLTYSYYDGSNTQSSLLTVDNNDFLTVGSYSQITSTASNSEGVVFNRSMGLNFNKGYVGYEINPSLPFSPSSQGTLEFDTDYPTNAEINGGLLSSFWGNGTFLKGRWKKGIWNNGPRVNDNFSSFDITFLDSIDNFFENGIDRWQVNLSSIEPIPTTFNVGDYISIGNIVALTVNDERKLLTETYQIINIDRSLNTLSVITKVTFPIKSVEKDSDNHRIMITNNVWESGTFHNGRFEGVWNYGNFEGYPNITTMENTQWIDGILNGGRISSIVAVDSINREYNTCLIQNADINLRNFEDNTLSETVLDLVYDGTDPNDNPFYSHLVVSRIVPINIQTTRDILTSNIRVLYGSPTNIQERNLSLGVKFKRYDDIIGDDLNGISEPETLSSRGWTFSEIFSGDILPSNQEKFLGYDSGGGEPLDQIQINTYNNPLSGNFGSTELFTIGHDNLSNIQKDRYWELSYTNTDRNNSYGATSTSGSGSYIIPFGGQSGNYHNISSSKFVGNEIKEYYWNFPTNFPLIYLNNGVVAKLDDIKFTEVDYIPTPNFIDININPDNRLKLPKFSTSTIGVFSEADSNFIDNNQLSK